MDVFGSLRRLAETGLGIVQNRVALFAVEVEEETQRLVAVLIWVSAAVAFSLMALAMVTLTIIVLCWDNGRAAALISLSAVYLLAAGGACLGLARRLKGGPKPFSATLFEIEKDKEWLNHKP